MVVVVVVTEVVVVVVVVVVEGVGISGTFQFIKEYFLLISRKRLPFIHSDVTCSSSTLAGYQEMLTRYDLHFDTVCTFLGLVRPTMS